jgi:hypothetical protein
MLSRLITSALAGAIAWLICVIAGALLVATSIPILTVAGGLLEQYAVAISIIVALLNFFGGFALPTFTRK